MPTVYKSTWKTADIPSDCVGGWKADCGSRDVDGFISCCDSLDDVELFCTCDDGSVGLRLWLFCSASGCGYIPQPNHTHYHLFANKRVL